MVPSTRTFITSSNGAFTVPIRIQKWSVAGPPAGIVTLWPSVAVSGAAMPPNQAQISPVRGGEAPPPLPHEAKSHNGVPKLVDVSGSQVELGMPPFSNPPSTITSVPPAHGVELGVGEGGMLGVGEGVPGVGVGPQAPVGRKR